MIGSDTAPDVEVVNTFTTPGGQPGVLEQLRERERRQRRELGRLDDHGAAGGERRRDLAGRHREREVPRGDEEARADRMLRHDHAAGALGVRPVAALDARRLLAEPADELAAIRDLAARLGERLAHLDRHEQREVLLALLQQIERATQDLGPLPRRRRRPSRERLDGGIERGLAVGGRGIGDLLDHATRRGVVDASCLPSAAARHSPPMKSLSGTRASSSVSRSTARDLFSMPRVTPRSDGLGVILVGRAWPRDVRRVHRRPSHCSSRRPRWHALRKQRTREEGCELVGRRERQHGGNVLVGADDDDHAVGGKLALGEDVGACPGARPGGVDLLPVRQLERTRCAAVKRGGTRVMSISSNGCG